MMFALDVIDATIRLCVPILFVALGELVSQRGGIINIGLEGFMSVGAYIAFAVLASTQNPGLAILCGALGGVISASVMAGLAVWGRANQLLVGFALFVALPGIGAFLAQQDQSGAFAAALDVIPIPLLSEIPFIGRLLFAQNIFFYGVILSTLVVHIGLTRSRLGLSISACGQDVHVAHSKGIDVKKFRTVAVLVCGLLSGIGGAALSIGALGSFTPGITDGRGFVAIALVILGRWRVGGVVLAAFGISLIDALRLQLGGMVAVPTPILAMVPWLVVFGMLIFTARRSGMPPMLGKE